jgi:hypothetical protein
MATGLLLPVVHLPVNSLRVRSCGPTQSVQSLRAIGVVRAFEHCTDWPRGLSIIRSTTASNRGAVGSTSAPPFTIRGRLGGLLTW